jgi:HSP20 family molecular chaperone IbpA
MNDQQQVATPSSSSASSSAAQHSERESEYPLIPPADVYQDGEGITLHLDMPGVSKDRLNIPADKNTLVIEGDVQIAMPAGMEPLYAEIQTTRYQRSFTLSGELDADKAAANLSNGVLSVSIPLRAELKPRKIEIKVT